MWLKFWQKVEIQLKIICVFANIRVAWQGTYELFKNAGCMPKILSLLSQRASLSLSLPNLSGYTIEEEFLNSIYGYYYISINIKYQITNIIYTNIESVLGKNKVPCERTKFLVS